MSIIVCSVRVPINISSAYAEHCVKRVDMLRLSSSCFKISSITILNRVADNVSPCLAPVVISNFSVSFWFILTLAFVSCNVLAICLINLLAPNYFFKF